MNSDELFEIAYCKGKRESMKSMVMWLKEHAGFARDALSQKDKMSSVQVLNILLNSMERAYAIMEEDLSKKVVLLSLQERPTVQLEEVKKDLLEKE